jgi:hypothetical protein
VCPAVTQNDPDPQRIRRAGSSAFARRIRRAGVLLFCAAYLLTTAWFTLRHVLGDSLSHPVAYFFTWDMFPGYVTESSRRMVVGHTQDERFVKLLPSESHRFRWGINNEVSRLDVDRNAKNLEWAIEQSVGEYNDAHSKSPIKSVLIVEQYWPSRFNLPDDLHREHYGEPNPHRRYWRFLEVSVGQAFQPDPNRQAVSEVRDASGQPGKADLREGRKP